MAFPLQATGNHQATLSNYLSRTSCSDSLSETPPTGQIPKLTFFGPLGGLSKKSPTAVPATQRPRWGVGEDALTAGGKEGCLPQEEGGVHMAQGFLHVPEAGARKRTTGQTSPQRRWRAAFLNPERPKKERRVRRNTPRGILHLSFCWSIFNYKVTQACTTIR